MKAKRLRNLNTVTRLLAKTVYIAVIILIQFRNSSNMFIYPIRSGFLVTASAASSLGLIEADSASETQQIKLKKKKKKGPSPIPIPLTSPSFAVHYI